MSLDYVTLLKDCYELSGSLHEMQYYGQGDRPYFEFHILVVKEKTRQLCPYDTEYFQSIYQSVALLHDVVEDCDITCDQLLTEHNIPQEVVTAVDAITKRDNETRKEYLIRCKANEIALLVKKADTLCNLEQSVIDGDVRRVNKYTKQLAYLCKV